MRRWVLIPRDEALAGARAQASKYQRKANGCVKHILALEAKNERLREQIEVDRIYLNAVKREAWHLMGAINREIVHQTVRKASESLRRVLEGEDQ